MTTVMTWTGREATALRTALRMSVSHFADYLGAGRRTVVKWGTRGSTVTLSLEMQAALDTVVQRAPAEVVRRFEALIAHDSRGAIPRRDLLAASAVGVVGTILTNSSSETRMDIFPTHADLACSVAEAKKDYQACSYDRLLHRLTTVVPAMEAALSVAAGDDRARLSALAAHLFHVMGSVLLKLGDHPMALLAADRSVRHAAVSEDPLVAGTSARIMTHALMRNGHERQAVGYASTAAQRVETATHLRETTAAAVYGALMLRGAEAAATAKDRSAAETMLDDAASVAAKLGYDGNEGWTGFGPTNVLQHRVHVALSLGDTSAAIDYVHSVPLHRIQLTERRVSHYVDTAHAYMQSGQHDQALKALLAAQREAPEEVRARPAVSQLTRDLAAHSKGPLRAKVLDFTISLGSVA